MVITIDGPAGTGKSTVARELAKRLGYHFLDTGAMYRCVALQCLEEGIDPNDPEAVAAILPHCEPTALDGTVTLNGTDVANRIRTPEVTHTASLIATQPAVRNHLTTRQRAVAKGRNLVTEGRDQGTVVFPDAEFKFYLDATVEERARRRFEQLKAAGTSPNLANVQLQMAERDKRDRERLEGPLQAHADAVSIDADKQDAETVVQVLVHTCSRAIRHS